VTHTRLIYICDTYTSRNLCDTHMFVYMCDTRMSCLHVLDTHDVSYNVDSLMYVSMTRVRHTRLEYCVSHTRPFARVTHTGLT